MNVMYFLRNCDEQKDPEGSDRLLDVHIGYGHFARYTPMWALYCDYIIIWPKRIQKQFHVYVILNNHNVP